MGISTYFLSPLYKLLTSSSMAPMAFTSVSHSTSFTVRAFFCRLSLLRRLSVDFFIAFNLCLMPSRCLYVILLDHDAVFDHFRRVTCSQLFDSPSVPGYKTQGSVNGKPAKIRIACRDHPSHRDEACAKSLSHQIKALLLIAATTIDELDHHLIDHAIIKGPMA
ncbi:hypothetical protein BP00DRAFT_46567 [Aspergillus indologenus CBS 114.80]|uniref:Uncharacterized protein n=1 Tax=Aspergillus indologenus CBS 114.80 TaxID=1450541 RepID=A0A2V5HQN9_9EURO|nr:hypothetical protein BP00DRAFT_46567 [Aspergillus indologenus CBS 114.80]